MIASNATTAHCIYLYIFGLPSDGRTLCLYLNINGFVISTKMLKIKSISKLYNWSRLFSARHFSLRFTHTSEMDGGWIVGGASFNQTTRYISIQWVEVFQSVLHQAAKTTTAYFQIKNLRVYLSERVFISTSESTFHLFVVVISSFFLSVFLSLIPLIFHEWMAWSAHSVENQMNSVGERLIFVFIQISTIRRLIYLMRWYESRARHFLFCSHLQLFRLEALSHSTHSHKCRTQYPPTVSRQRPRMPSVHIMIDSYIHKWIIMF